jgi:hypothetical protein
MGEFNENATLHGVIKQSSRVHLGFLRGNLSCRVARDSVSHRRAIRRPQPVTVGTEA